jgi:hypothetical protein
LRHVQAAEESLSLAEPLITLAKQSDILEALARFAREIAAPHIGT